MALKGAPRYLETLFFIRKYNLCLRLCVSIFERLGQSLELLWSKWWSCSLTSPLGSYQFVIFWNNSWQYFPSIFAISQCHPLNIGYLIDQMIQIMMFKSCISLAYAQGHQISKKCFENRELASFYIIKTIYWMPNDLGNHLSRNDHFHTLRSFYSKDSPWCSNHPKTS